MIIIRDGIEVDQVEVGTANVDGDKFYGSWTGATEVEPEFRTRT
jgi:hypothetical protein